MKVVHHKITLNGDMQTRLYREEGREGAGCRVTARMQPNLRRVTLVPHTTHNTNLHRCVGDATHYTTPLFVYTSLLHLGIPRVGCAVGCGVTRWTHDPLHITPYPKAIPPTKE